VGTGSLSRPAVLFGFAGWLVVAASCGHPTPLESPLGLRALTPPPSSDGSCRFDLTGDKADTVFFVLGMLDEYNGRNLIEDDDRVERFYCNESGASRLFRRYIGTLAAEQGLDSAVRDETIETCLIVYHSTPIASRLNSCYRYTMTDQILAQAPDGTYRRTANPSLRASGLFARVGGAGSGSTDEANRRRALAYLAGAWARYRRDGDFVFANAHDKAALVAALLTDLGCRNLRIESTIGFIPQTNRVRFEATDEVMAWLRKDSTDQSVGDISLSLRTEHGRALFRDCRLDINVIDNRGRTSLECTYSSESPKVLRTERTLTRTEISDVSALAGASDLCSGGHVGRDETALDGELETLMTRCRDNRVAVLVTSGNPTFSSNDARRRLLERMHALDAELLKSALPPK